MADVKISALPAASAANTTDELPANQAGTTRKVTVAQLFSGQVNQTYEDFTSQSSDPSTPGAGVLRMWARSTAGRVRPRWMGPSGINTAFQASLDGNTVVMWLPGTGTTAAINFGVNWSIGATQAHPTIAATNIMTSIRRATYTTTTTSGNASGTYSGAPVAILTTTSGMGGFFFAARFGVLTFTSTMQIWVGLSAQSTILAGQPNAVANSAFIGKISTDTTWKFYTVDNTPTAGSTDSTHTVAAAANAEIMDFYMFSAPGAGGTITGRLVDVTGPTVYIDNVARTGNLPANNSLLYAHAECRNSAGGAGSAVAMFLAKMYIESDN